MTYSSSNDSIVCCIVFVIPTLERFAVAEIIQGQWPTILMPGVRTDTANSSTLCWYLDAVNRSLDWWGHLQMPWCATIWPRKGFLLVFGDVCIDAGGYWNTLTHFVKWQHLITMKVSSDRDHAHVPIMQ